MRDSVKSVPKVFLSYASEDRELAKRIAEGFTKNSIDTWWDEWEIRAGDSIRQKIDEGLRDCTHFVVLLTPNSIDKPWVKTEIDAGFIQDVDDKAKFIPLRSNLPVEHLSDLLRSRRSPELSDDLEWDIGQLISDIYGITKKPEKGKGPAAIEQPESNYSPAAMAVAEYFCRETKYALQCDPDISEEDLAAAASLSLMDTQDALYELDYFMEDDSVIGCKRVTPNIFFWAEFDQYFPYGGNPKEDAFKIAADLVNGQNSSISAKNLLEKYEWEPRRLNPALSYLIENEIISYCDPVLDGFRCVTSTISETPATRLFVKNHA